MLRDEGEAYAAPLRSAGVEVTTVRYDGITHDFMMLNPLSATHATRAAIAQAIAILREALQTGAQPATHAGGPDRAGAVSPLDLPADPTGQRTEALARSELFDRGVRRNPDERGQRCERTKAEIGATTQGRSDFDKLAAQLPDYARRGLPQSDQQPAPSGPWRHRAGAWFVRRLCCRPRVASDMLVAADSASGTASSSMRAAASS